MNKTAQQLTSNKLDAAGHTSNRTWDEVGDAAAHESCERHQQEEAAPHTRHHRADPPLQARDAVEGGVAPALLQHHRGLPLLVPHRVGAAAEGAKGHGLVHLRPQQPVGHEEADAGGSSTQQGQQRPDNTRTCQTGAHGKQCAGGSHSHWTITAVLGAVAVLREALQWAFNTSSLHLVSDSGSLSGRRQTSRVRNHRKKITFWNKHVPQLLHSNTRKIVRPANYFKTFN